MDDKKSWDNIPSLDNLRVDWDYAPENPHGRRDSRRLSGKTLVSLFGVPAIPIKIATSTTICKGILQDISNCGVAVRVQQPLAENEKVKVGFFLGSNKIICKGLVKHTCSDTLGYTSGISLLDMAEDNKQIIQELYASAVLKEAI